MGFLLVFQQRERFAELSIQFIWTIAHDRKPAALEGAMFGYLALGHSSGNLTV
jgi:hypothetical protein